MISTRFAVPVAITLALALVPTIIHSYRDDRLDDGRRASGVPAVLEGHSSSPTSRKAVWVQNNMGSSDWIERTYIVEGVEVQLFVARSYDAKRLYHHPELALLRTLQTTPAGIGRTATRPDVPLHLLRLESGERKGLAVYALRYDDRFIQDPVLFQLRTSLRLLVSGRKPLTLFMGSALRGDQAELDKAPATRIVLAAIAAFERSSGQP